MNFLSLLLFLGVSPAQAREYSADVRISIRMENASLDEVIWQIQKETDFVFFYNSQDVKSVTNIDVSVSDASVEEILDKVLKDTNLEYKVTQKGIVIKKRPPVEQDAKPIGQNQEKVVKGIVSDAGNGMGLPGVNVFVKGTTLGTVTDIDGNFQLDVKDGATLVFSFIGYQKQEIAYSGQEFLTVALAMETSEMDEVVVVGYGTTKIRDLTGSVVSVKANDIENSSATSLQDVMIGKAAGVMVNQGTAKPGAVARVRIRGGSSFEGTNEPLYVVDGIAMGTEELLSLNPSDIHSMDILKDASAAAIYGSRAANGVIIITTKRGQQGDKPKFNVNHSTRIDRYVNNFHILTGDEFRAVMRKAAEDVLAVDPGHSGAEEILNPQNEDEGLYDGNTDWFDELSQQAITHNTELSIGGGNKQVQYYFSLSNLQQDGVIKGDELKRQTARLNLDWNVTNRLKFGTSTLASYTNQKNAGASLLTCIGTRPDVPVYDEEGNYHLVNDKDNPVARNQATNKNRKYRFLTNLYGELELMDGLKFKSAYSINKTFSRSTRFDPSFLLAGNDYGRISGRGYEYFGESVRTTFDNTLTFDKEINEMHSLNLVVGASMEEYESDYFSASGADYPFDEKTTNLGSAATMLRMDGDGSVWGMNSFFTRLNYKLLDRYLFTFTARYDGSSNFGENNKYGFFPSGAFAWRINKESFLEDVNAINELKLKLSVGKTGTQDIGDFRNIDVFTTSDYMGNPAVIPSILGNKDISWESSTQYDAAVDFALFNHRLSGSVGVYYKDTRDLLWNVPLAVSSGYSSIYQNVGRVVNKGVELFLNGVIFDSNDFKWDLSFNLAANRNKVKELVDDNSLVTNLEGTVLGSSNEVLAEGYAAGSILGYVVEGIFQSQDEIDALDARAEELSEGEKYYYQSSSVLPGHMKYKDLNGDGYIDESDRTIIGNPEPDFFGGFVTNLKYKQFSLYASFGFAVGQERIFSETIQGIPSTPNNLIDYNLDNRWSPENPDAKLPALYFNDYSYTTVDLEVHDASYLRLNELRLEYAFPTLKDKRFYNAASLYFSATNLFTLSNYPGMDPAAVSAGSDAVYTGNTDNAVYPSVKTYTVGLKVNF